MTTVKCKYCKQDIDKELDKWFCYNKINCHHNCYITYMNNKPNADIIQIKKQADTLLKEQEDKLLLAQAKDNFYKYIQTRYSITFLPKYTFIKMNEIFEGTYKGLAEPINVEDLLTMFQKKEHALDIIYERNLTKGKTLDNIGRFNYDLAIMLSQYDKYRAWKEKHENMNKTASGDKQVSESIKKADMVKVMSEQMEKQRIVDEIDIQKYIDEI